MRPLEEFLQRVEGQLAAVDLAKSQGSSTQVIQRLNKLRDPKGNRDTHCRTCGLPHDKHVPHDPPDVPKPEGPATAKEWGPYMRAQSKLYREALSTLTDGELLGMPVPISKRRLMDLAAEVKTRLEKPTLSRYDLIAGNDDEDDDSL